MESRDLELFSSEDLIDELLGRATFQGVIIHSKEEARSPDWSGQRVFRVRLNQNLGTEEAGRLLDVVGQYIAGQE
ncbi:hypothetical protein ACYOEI_22530 [Singulisphaera rosea]